MALKNYKLEDVDGNVVYRQFDEGDDAGKQALEALRDAAKDSNLPLKSVTQGDPAPLNKDWK